MVQRSWVKDDRLRECDATEAEVGILHARRVELNALSTEQLVDLVEGRHRRARHREGDPEHRGPGCRLARRKAHAEIVEIVKIIEKGNRRAASRWQKAPTPDDLDDGSGS